MPWPLTPPELLLHATFLDLLSTEGCYLMTQQSIKELPEGASLPPADGKRDRLDMAPGSCLKLTPLPPRRGAAGSPAVPQVRSEMMIHIDAHKASVPTFVVQFVLKVLSPFIYKQVARLLKKNFHEQGDALPQRMLARAELYDTIRARVAEHLAAQQQQQQQQQGSSSSSNYSSSRTAVA